MPRSKRRWAVSLHEVAKCTLPNRCSFSSWQATGDAIDTTIAATAIANAQLDLFIGALRLVPVPSRPRSLEPDRRARQADGPPVAHHATPPANVLHGALARP